MLSVVSAAGQEVESLIVTLLPGAMEAVLRISVNGVQTFITPNGEAHVPSPLQNVDEDALVPELRWLTPRLPVTSELARLTALEVTA